MYLDTACGMMENIIKGWIRSLRRKISSERTPDEKALALLPGAACFPGGYAFAGKAAKSAGRKLSGIMHLTDTQSVRSRLTDAPPQRFPA